MEVKKKFSKILQKGLWEVFTIEMRNYSGKLFLTQSRKAAKFKDAVIFALLCVRSFRLRPRRFS